MFVLFFCLFKKEDVIEVFSNDLVRLFWILKTLTVRRPAIPTTWNFLGFRKPGDSSWFLDSFWDFFAVLDLVEDALPLMHRYFAYFSALFGYLENNCCYVVFFEVYSDLRVLLRFLAIFEFLFWIIFEYLSAL